MSTSQGISRICLVVFVLALAYQQNVMPRFYPKSAPHPVPQPKTPAATAAVVSNRWALDTIVGAYKAYGSMAQTEVDKMRASYGRMNAEHRQLGGKLKYPAKLDKFAAAERANGFTTDAIANLAIRERGINASLVENRQDGSSFRVREALQHWVRDWSEEGLEERAPLFDPILDVLRLVQPETRLVSRVLVPGAGMGRLAWEISELGFKTTANELSPYMNCGFQYLLNPSTTPEINSHQIHPWAHKFSNQRTTDRFFRRVAIPDVLPRRSYRFIHTEGDFLQLKPPLRGGKEPGYDFVVTLFFIDASSNVAAILQKIHALLIPGGTWINLGPLLWAGGGVVGLELSLDEVMDLTDMVGFEVLQPGGEEDVKRARTVPCQYTADKHVMLKRIYAAQFWVATKRVNSDM